MTAHVIVCVCADTDAFRRVHRRREQERRRSLGCWARVLLCIIRWPLKVALCHNTLVPMTPAAVKCHRPLLSASQPAQSLQTTPSSPSPIQKAKALDYLIRLGFVLWFSSNNRQNRVVLDANLSSYIMLGVNLYTLHLFVWQYETYLRDVLGS